MITKETKMLLFRYSNYKKLKFIKEHESIITNDKYAWMMKIGKRTSISKIEAIMQSGGYMVLKSPVAEGNLFYLARFVDFSEELPEDEAHMPKYYSEIIEDDAFWDAPTQFFKIVDLIPLKQEYVESLVLDKNKRKVVEVVNETRTAVMFIENTIDFDVSLMQGEQRWLQ